MTLTTPGRFTTANSKVIFAKEYGLIEVGPGEVFGPDGRLALTPGVLNRYVRADFKNNELRLTAKGVTGLIPLTDRLTVQVRPRFPLRNLTHMVSVCGYVPTVVSALREYTSTDRFSDWMLDVMADALLAAFDVIVLNGLLRTYHRRTAVSSYPHGRIDTTATVLRHASRGINHQAQYSWFERTTDNAPNRCLKSAMVQLHAHYVCLDRQGGVRERIARLGAALRALQCVSLESRPISLEDPQVRGVAPLPETRSYYRPALELAVAVLTRRGVSLDVSTGRVQMRSLLVKTEDLFEEFVRLSLQDTLADQTGLSVLDGNRDPGRLPLYEQISKTQRQALPTHEVPALPGRAPDANPDIVFRLADGTHPVVADVKYTEVKDFADRSEVEQVVLYGVRYRSPVVLTIHPRRHGAAKGLHVAGRIGPMIVAQYRVDLGADSLEAEMEGMAAQIKELIASQIPASASPASQTPPPPP
ncbi:McrC family protein [Prescottella equi]|uniref:McrC family protein n=1 Tax=Rhodococcus hoagii TaxID=43767 RepID=UPI001EEA57F3|nr:McrC family protein [Prescottella equi]